MLTLHQCLCIDHSLMEMLLLGKCELLVVDSYLQKQPLANYVYYI